MSYLDEIFNLQGKVAVVIGAGGHICGALAEGYARAGCSVALLDIRLEKAIVVETNLREHGF